MEEKVFSISLKQLQELANYLVTKPYEEVAGLMGMLNTLPQEIKPNDKEIKELSKK